MSDNRDDLPELSTLVTNHNTVVNENAETLRPAGDFGVIPSETIALTISLASGIWNVGGIPTEVAAFTDTLDDNDVSYVQMSDAGIVSVTTTPPTGWPEKDGIFTALHDFTTLAGVITVHNDWRSPMSPGVSASGIAAALGLDSITRVGDDIIFTDGAKSVILTLV